MQQASQSIPDEWDAVLAELKEVYARADKAEAEVERLKAENEAARAVLASSKERTARQAELEAGIEAALAIPKELRTEMSHPLWPSLTPDDLLSEIEERLVKALTGGRE